LNLSQAVNEWLKALDAQVSSKQQRKMQKYGRMRDTSEIGLPRCEMIDGERALDLWRNWVYCD